VWYLNKGRMVNWWAKINLDKKNINEYWSKKYPTVEDLTKNKYEWYNIKGKVVK
jgi:hypothetical protein